METIQNKMDDEPKEALRTFIYDYQTYRLKVELRKILIVVNGVNHTTKDWQNEISKITTDIIDEINRLELRMGHL